MNQLLFQEQLRRGQLNEITGFNQRIRDEFEQLRAALGAG